MLLEREQAGASLVSSFITNQSNEYKILMEKHQDMLANLEQRDSHNNELRGQLDKANQDITSLRSQLRAKSQTIDNLREIIAN